MNLWNKYSFTFNIQRLNKDATAFAALLAFLFFLNSSIIGLTIDFSYSFSSSLFPYSYTNAY
jgi:hypothetical protein